MADPKENIVEQTEILDQAISRKWNKFTWSGLMLIGIGLITIAFGLLLRMGAYSPEGLVIGLGAIVILIGIVRLLIGLINPLAPSDLHHTAAPHEPTDKEILEATLDTGE
jgi:hypothetical protein